LRRLAAAAISARLLAEQAAREGFDVIALDCFGDRDTRRAASRWLPIGDAASLAIDGARLLPALEALARSGAAQAWIVGSGFDGRAELLAEGAKRLPLIGNSAAAVHRVRDAQRFFDTLDAHGIAHPPLRWQGTPEPGWLVKDSAGCGGMHVRRAGAALPLGASQYLQREMPGTPLSATFVANGREAVVLGCNEQIVQALGDAPFVFSGVIGPLPPNAVLQHAVETALATLVPAFGLRGLGSLDLLRDGDALSVLELNPRPSASLALYADAEPLRAHMRACRDGALPPRRERAPPLRGLRTVFSRRTFTLDARAADHLAAQADTRDLPAPGRFEPGQPLCSVHVDEGASAEEVRQRLSARCEALLDALENAR
jgi:predicted ATP-grasp superfamily ATP-dependent carboligase